MARIKYSGLIESIRGSIGGTTFQGNKYGFTAKAKGQGVDPLGGSDPPPPPPLYLVKAVSGWRELTAAQRIAWNSWASTYPQYTKHNPTAQLSGYNVFSKIGVYRYMVEESYLVNPAFELYAVDTLVFGVTLGAGVLTLTIESTLDSNEWYLLIFLSFKFPKSRSFIGTIPKFISYAGNYTGTLHLTSNYLKVYGQLPEVGDSLAMSVVPFGQGNGQFAAKQSFIVEVTAA